MISPSQYTEPKKITEPTSTNSSPSLGILAHLDVAKREGLEPNLRRMLGFLGHRDGEWLQLESLPPKTPDPEHRDRFPASHFAFTNSADGAVRLLTDFERGDFQYQGLYVYPNVINEAITCRARPNVWTRQGKDAGTRDGDILRRRMVYLDFDPVREHGAKDVSATIGEFQATFSVALAAYRMLVGLVGEDPLGICLSGNGAQIWIAVDLPNTEVVTESVKSLLLAVQTLFEVEQVVDVDVTVADPKRIAPAAGTTKRKGAHSPDRGRPHRRTSFACSGTIRRLDEGEFTKLVAGVRARLTPEQLIEGVEQIPARPTTVSRNRPEKRDTHSAAAPSMPDPFDAARRLPIRDVAMALGMDVSDPRCPGCGAGGGSDVALLDEQGMNILKCLHATCGARAWTTIDLVIKIALGREPDEPGASVEAVNWLAERFSIPEVSGRRDDMCIEDVLATLSTDSAPSAKAMAVATIAPALSRMSPIERDAVIDRLRGLGIRKGTIHETVRRASGTRFELPPGEGSWQEDLSRDRDGRVAATTANVLAVLANDSRWSGVLRYDEFANEIVFGAAPPWHADDAASRPVRSGALWVDDDDTRMSSWLARHYGIRIQPHAVMPCVVVAARRHGVHPVREYLSSLKWDDQRRLDSVFVRHLGAEDSPYVREVAMRWFVGAVARIFEPGCKMDMVPVLISKQGLGKAKFLRGLAGDWYLNLNGNFRDVETLKRLQARWLVEFAELAGMKRSDNESTKSFVTDCEDTYRPSYARRVQRHPRQCVFIGTANDQEFLTDSTGNRRWYPILCLGAPGSFDEVVLLAERDQLWAEAVATYRERGAYWPEDEAFITAARSAQEASRSSDSWEEIIEEYIADKEFVSTRNVLTLAIGVSADRISKADEMRVAKALRLLGWTRDKESGRRGYVRTSAAAPMKSPDAEQRELDVIRAAVGKV